MTTAKTRRSGTTAGSREGTIAKPASRASEAIPVLIRLPRLVTEPEPGEVCYPAEDEAEIRATIAAAPIAAAEGRPGAAPHPRTQPLNPPLDPP